MAGRVETGKEVMLIHDGPRLPLQVAWVVLGGAASEGRDAVPALSLTFRLGQAGLDVAREGDELVEACVPHPSDTNGHRQSRSDGEHGSDTHFARGALPASSSSTSRCALWVLSNGCRHCPHSQALRAKHRRLAPREPLAGTTRQQPKRSRTPRQPVARAGFQPWPAPWQGLRRTRRSPSRPTLRQPLEW